MSGCSTCGTSKAAPSNYVTKDKFISHYEGQVITLKDGTKVKLVKQDGNAQKLY